MPTFRFEPDKKLIIILKKHVNAIFFYANDEIFKMREKKLNYYIHHINQPPHTHTHTYIYIYIYIYINIDVICSIHEVKSKLVSSF